MIYIGQNNEIPWIYPEFHACHMYKKVQYAHSTIYMQDSK